MLRAAQWLVLPSECYRVRGSGTQHRPPSSSFAGNHGRMKCLENGAKVGRLSSGEEERHRVRSGGGSEQQRCIREHRARERKPPFIATTTIPPPSPTATTPPSTTHMQQTCSHRRLFSGDALSIDTFDSFSSAKPIHTHLFILATYSTQPR